MWLALASHFGALAAGSRQARKVAGGLVSRSRVVDDDELGLRMTACWMVGWMMDGGGNIPFVIVDGELR